MIIKSENLASLNREGKTKTLNVLHLINGEHFSGAERVQDLLGMQLPQFGYEAMFGCLKAEKFPRYRQSKSQIFEGEMRSKLDMKCIKHFTEIAREQNCAIIHAHSPRSLMVGSFVAKRTKTPLIYHVHSPVSRDSRRKVHNFFNTMMEKWCLRRVTKMICVSNSLHGYMRDEIGHDPERLAVVQNGVPVVNDLPERTVPDQKWTIGTMALFRQRKGTEVLLHAMAKLKADGLNVHLRAVGPFETPEYKTEIMYLVQKLGLEESITWTGFQKDINEQLNQMDLFVLPSLYGEGLPMVVLESMACAVPVVASRVEGIPEAIRDNVDGLIFEPGSGDDLAEKLATIIRSPERWEPMRQSALKRQREQLSDVNMARLVSQVYDDVLNG